MTRFLESRTTERTRGEIVCHPHHAALQSSCRLIAFFCSFRILFMNRHFVNRGEERLLTAAPIG